MNTMSGRAVAAKRTRKLIFTDPAWEDRFDQLILLTQRTALIQEITGTDLRSQRIKEEIDRRYGEMGEEVNRPRGVGRDYTSKTFISSKTDKYDAAYLIALHFGSRGAGEYAEAETNLAKACDKRLAVYNKYRSDYYSWGVEPRISFESYYLMVQGIKERAIEVHQCGDCNSRYPVSASHQGQTTCPVCSIQDLRMDNANLLIEERLAAKRAATEQTYKFG